MSPAVWIKKLFTLRPVKCEEYVRGASRVTLVTYNSLVPQENETCKTQHSITLPVPGFSPGRHRSKELHATKFLHGY